MTTTYVTCIDDVDHRAWLTGWNAEYGETFGRDIGDQYVELTASRVAWLRETMSEDDDGCIVDQTMMSGRRIAVICIGGTGYELTAAKG